MVTIRSVLGAAGLVLVASWATGLDSAPPSDTAVQEIQAFNREFREATLRMNNARVVALWDEAGVSLLPGLAPIIGKQAISQWLDDLVHKMPGYRVTKQENVFHDIQVSGDWASEWGETRQVVSPPDGKPPIEGRGKVLLVLHRNRAGEWKIRQEMWNPGPRE